MRRPCTGIKVSNKRNSQALGLKLALSAPLVLSKTGKVTVQLSVTDRQALPVSGANVVLDALLNAYADRVQRSLREVSPGLYVGELAPGVRGLRSYAVVQQAALRYTQVLRVDVSKADAA